MFGGLLQKAANESGKAEPAFGGKSALLIIAPENFRDEECFHTREELEKAGISVTIASLSTGDKKGALGGVARAEIALKDVNVADYDTVIFVGGGGSAVYFNDPLAQKIAKDSHELGKVTAAICIAPVILANAGVLEGKKATVWESADTKAALKAGGATYTGKTVEADGKVVTGNGPAAAREFGRAIAGLLE
ncbi:MAG: DJ-1/PfpI family protein [Candidatus Aenigmatarchaeota archaeon]